MDRNQKQELIEELNSAFKGASLVVVTHQTGLSVPQSRELRKKARESGCSHKVTKNTLTKLALKGTDFECMSGLFKGPTAITWSGDAIAAARAINDYAKTNDKVKIVGGALNGKLLDEAGIKYLATLPSMDELRGKLIGVLQAPASKIARVIATPAGNVARVINAYATKDA